MSETNLMRHLASKPSDQKGAFFKIPKNMSLMFLHAVQSAVWNKVASLRVEAHGCDRAVEGDLVETGAAERVAGSTKDTQLAGKEVKVVTAEEAASGSYKVEDVVLPLPGNKVLVPPSCEGFYKTVLRDVLGLEVTDEADMKKLFTNSETKEFTLGGDYRKMLCRVDDLTWNVVAYDEPTAPLIETDLMNLTGDSLKFNDTGALLGLVVGFTLPSSSYATVAMRELTKAPQLPEFLKTVSLVKKGGGKEGEVAGNVPVKEEGGTVGVEEKEGGVEEAKGEREGSGNVVKPEEGEGSGTK